MKQYNKFFAVIFLSTLIYTSVFSNSQPPEETPLTHVVICWLNEELNEKEIEKIIVEIKNLINIEGIVDLQVGRSIESERDIVDDSFTLAITMRFNSLEDMKAYLADEDHVKFVNEVLKPNLKKIVVYDFEN